MPLAGMSFTMPAKPYEPPFLNEKLIYITSFSMYVGLLFALFHVMYDLDYLAIPKITMSVTPRQRLAEKMPAIAIMSAVGAVIVSLTFPIIYAMGIRRTAWSYSLVIARRFITLHRSNGYQSFPFGFIMLIQCLFSSFLFFFWVLFANQTFSIYVSLGPVHRGAVLSSQARNSNETLVTGLKLSAKPLTQMLALRELAYISVNDSARRKSIFKHVDRRYKMWDEIYRETQKPIRNLIQSLQKPIAITTHTSKGPVVKEMSKTAIISVRREDVFKHSKAKPLIINIQDPSAKISDDFLSFLISKYDVFKKYLKKYSTLSEIFIASPLGYPFRHTIQRQINILIPTPVLIEHAIFALSHLVDNSMEEDIYGSVQHDIPGILAMFCEAMDGLETFMSMPPIHWTDTSSLEAKDAPKFYQLERLHNIFSEGFELIVTRFELYLDDLQVSNAVRKRFSILQQESLREMSEIER